MTCQQNDQKYANDSDGEQFREEDCRNIQPIRPVTFAACNGHWAMALRKVASVPLSPAALVAPESL